LADGTVTYLGLGAGLTEINGIQLWLFAHVGVGAALVMSKGLVCMLAITSWHAGLYRTVVALRLIYAGVVTLPFATMVLQLR